MWPKHIDDHADYNRYTYLHMHLLVISHKKCVRQGSYPYKQNKIMFLHIFIFTLLNSTQKSNADSPIQSVVNVFRNTIFILLLISKRLLCSTFPKKSINSITKVSVIYNQTCETSPLIHSLEMLQDNTASNKTGDARV